MIPGPASFLFTLFLAVSLSISDCGASFDVQSYRERSYKVMKLPLIAANTASGFRDCHETPEPSLPGFDI